MTHHILGEKLKAQQHCKFVLQMTSLAEDINTQFDDVLDFKIPCAKFPLPVFSLTLMCVSVSQQTPRKLEKINLFSCSFFQKVCAKTLSSENQSLVMSQSPLKPLTG